MNLDGIDCSMSEIILTVLWAMQLCITGCGLFLAIRKSVILIQHSRSNPEDSRSFQVPGQSRSWVLAPARMCCVNTTYNMRLLFTSSVYCLFALTMAATKISTTRVMGSDPFLTVIYSAALASWYLGGHYFTYGWTLLSLQLVAFETRSREHYTPYLASLARLLSVTAATAVFTVLLPVMLLWFEYDSSDPSAGHLSEGDPRTVVVTVYYLGCGVMTASLVLGTRQAGDKLIMVLRHGLENIGDEQRTVRMQVVGRMTSLRNGLSRSGTYQTVVFFTMAFWPWLRAKAAYQIAVTSNVAALCVVLVIVNVTMPSSESPAPDSGQASGAEPGPAGPARQRPGAGSTPGADAGTSSGTGVDSSTAVGAQVILRTGEPSYETGASRHNFSLGSDLSVGPEMVPSRAVHVHSHGPPVSRDTPAGSLVGPAGTGLIPVSSDLPTHPDVNSFDLGSESGKVEVALESGKVEVALPGMANQ